jgi:hypothetical protein
MLKSSNENVVQPEQINNENIKIESNTDDQISYMDLVDLFGGGFSERECRQMYKKFIVLQENYPLRTKMHEEALITYVKYAFKRDQAIANDDMDAADKWGKLAAKQAQDAKINPSQLSAADLSDGMTSFSQLSATVEKAQDIIPLLPQFVEEPKDRVDYTLWEYINYARHLDGKPLIEYKQLYQFLSVRYESLKKRYKFMKKEDDGKFDENDIDSEV